MHIHIMVNTATKSWHLETRGDTGRNLPPPRRECRKVRFVLTVNVNWLLRPSFFLQSPSLYRGWVTGES